MQQIKSRITPLEKNSMSVFLLFPNKIEECWLKTWFFNFSISKYQLLYLVMRMTLQEL